MRRWSIECETEYVAVALEAGEHPGEAAGHRGRRSIALNRSACSASAARRRGGRRMQALFREFLQVHLEREVRGQGHPRDAPRHRARCEQDDWLIAAQHYAKAAEPGERDARARLGCRRGSRHRRMGSCRRDRRLDAGDSTAASCEGDPGPGAHQRRAPSGASHCWRASTGAISPRRSAASSASPGPRSTT